MYKAMKGPLFLFLLLSLAFCACEHPERADMGNESVPIDVLIKLTNLGFNVVEQAPIIFNEGYLVEGDLYLTKKDLASVNMNNIAVAEHYRSGNIVTGTPRNITVSIASSLSTTTYITALNDALARFNTLGLTLTFTRVTGSTADIVISRLPAAYETTGIFGSSGLPGTSGNPYSSILLSGILQSTYGFTSAGIASIITHHLGHCIGFYHTDCPAFCQAGEGTGAVGSCGYHIPGTPTTVTSTDRSWMLSCVNGSNRPFTSADQVALNYLY